MYPTLENMHSIDAELTAADSKRTARCENSWLISALVFFRTPFQQSIGDKVSIGSQNNDCGNK